MAELMDILQDRDLELWQSLVSGQWLVPNHLIFSSHFEAFSRWTIIMAVTSYLFNNFIFYKKLQMKYFSTEHSVDIIHATNYMWPV
jgi:hypothetical protein